MPLPFKEVVGVVLPILRQISGREHVGLDDRLGTLGITSGRDLFLLLTRIDRELHDRGYRTAAGLLAEGLTVATTVGELSRSISRLTIEPPREEQHVEPSKRSPRRPRTRGVQDRGKGLGAPGSPRVVISPVLPIRPITPVAPVAPIEPIQPIGPVEAVEVEPLPGDAAAPPYFTVPVFYGTTRARTTAAGFYGPKRGPLRYGVATVSVPSERRIGDIPRPSIWTLYRENPSKHYVLRDVEERSAEDFVADAKRHMAAGGSNEAFVFVHGFNVTFAAAVYRTAQIAADLNFGGAPMLFTWPSKGKLSRRAYTNDETEAEWTVQYLTEFLRTVDAVGAEKMHLIAHSMGNRALTWALSRLRAQGVAPARTFKELVLTAPDIDTETFVTDIAPAILPTANRVTLYASSKDVALAYSKRVHGYPRLGDSDDNLVTLEDVDTIDVSAVDTNLIGHFYYGDNRSVLSDLFNVIRGQLVPRFGLREKKKGKQRYWVFQP